MISSSYRTPLKTVGKETKNFVSASLPEHVVSPYLMKNSNPKKNFMSGTYNKIKIKIYMSIIVFVEELIIY